MKHGLFVSPSASFIEIVRNGFPRKMKQSHVIIHMGMWEGDDTTELKVLEIACENYIYVCMNVCI